MKPIPRLSGSLPAEFSSPVVNQAKPLQFRLNGRPIAGFEGDTVLSALLGAGLQSAGHIEGSAIALDDASAPAICLAGNEKRPDLAMPMVICPAIADASYATLGPSASIKAPGLSRILNTGRSGLGLSYAQADPEPGGWIDAEPTRILTADVAIVGGGVAGLAAAAAATERGLRVCLIEKDPVLGGISPFFGKAEGEPTAEDTIGTLASKIGNSGLVTLLLGTFAFGGQPGRVRAVRVARDTGAPVPEHLEISANTIILATGSVGRLPIFPGNRLPGVVDAAFAWRMAARYGVWPEKTTHIHTATNVGYRMALLGTESAREITRASDPRIAPQTRFIEFCKAYGFRMGWGAEIGAVATGGRDTLRISLQDSETGTEVSEFECGRLIVSGGWQPDLDLWIKAGGKVHWDSHGQRLAPAAPLEGVLLAGNAAGFKGLVGCRDHGAEVTRHAFDNDQRHIDDPQIDPAFEMPDGPLTIARATSENQAPAWLSRTCASALNHKATGWLRAVIPSHREEHAPFSGAQTQLDIVGLIVAGKLDPFFVERFAHERAILPQKLEVVGERADAVAGGSETLPSYLQDRFGADQRLWQLSGETGRAFDTGSLAFANTDDKATGQAVGVILGSARGATRILMRRAGFERGATVYIHDRLTTVPVKLDLEL